MIIVRSPAITVIAYFFCSFIQRSSIITFPYGKNSVDIVEIQIILSVFPSAYPTITRSGITR